ETPNEESRDHRGHPHRAAAGGRPSIGVGPTIFEAWVRHIEFSFCLVPRQRLVAKLVPQNLSVFRGFRPCGVDPDLPSPSYVLALLGPQAAPPGFIEPCIPTRADKPPAGPDWIHEIKHDGYRIMSRKKDGRARLSTRRG